MELPCGSNGGHEAEDPFEEEFANTWLYNGTSST